MSALLEVTDLKKHFPIYRGVFSRVSGHVYAVDGVSFSIGRGETLGLVGESGCGKSTVGRTLLKLLEPTAGSIKVDGQDITDLGGEELLPYRRRMQMIYQDPYASLNPRMTAGDIVGEPLVVHQIGTAAERRERVAGLFERCGLRPETIDRYPHEFSGGQRQRIGIARALALNPELIVGDEPVSALDVSIQAQIVNLMEDLQSKFDLTFLFIAHDLSVVRHISDRIAVMYLGKIVEIGPSNAIRDKPLHPYTKVLESSVPVPDPDLEAARKPILLKGEIPSPVNPPSGCRFHTRCPIAQPICSEVDPPLEMKEKGRFAACHFPGQL